MPPCVFYCSGIGKTKDPDARACTHPASVLARSVDLSISGSSSQMRQTLRNAGFALPMPGHALSVRAQASPACSSRPIDISAIFRGHPLNDVTQPPAESSRHPASFLDYIKAIPQYSYPHHLPSTLMRGITRIRSPRIKNWQIRWFIRQYGVDMGEALEPDPMSYGDFNAFFTRALAPGARPAPPGEQHIASPVDGQISAFGSIDDIDGGGIVQAKGHRYGVTELLSGGALDTETFAAPFRGGQFITIYLSPKDYHRVHMPIAGRPQGIRYIPGRLFSVNPATTRVIPRLFTRNERVAMVFDTANGPLALVMVGAIFVGGIETVWAGTIMPSYRQPVSIWRYDQLRHPELAFRQGQEIARFNMGSTVILLFPPNSVYWTPSLRSGTPLRMGASIGMLA
uniref:Phosphatidylserine decarboxylase proenzyme n=1 Tax=Candidatus Kentrum sp. LFY TaxID=2126342 RepID=A0A450UTC3_9GAMM|nr:MAG: phosphatidylserine decarboxylase [Candidatus Kentron sp. LFY]